MDKMRIIQLGIQAVFLALAVVFFVFFASIPIGMLIIAYDLLPESWMPIFDAYFRFLIGDSLIELFRNVAIYAGLAIAFCFAYWTLKEEW